MKTVFVNYILNHALHLELHPWILWKKKIGKKMRGENDWSVDTGITWPKEERASCNDCWSLGGLSGM